jgi:hypothetical protein
MLGLDELSLSGLYLFPGQSWSDKLEVTVRFNLLNLEVFCSSFMSEKLLNLSKVELREGVGFSAGHFDENAIGDVSEESLTSFWKSRPRNLTWRVQIFVTSTQFDFYRAK